jgi:hypothetical protein
LLTLSGCGGKYRVKGKLVYEDGGQPVTELAGFTVTFSSQELGLSAQGEIQPDGSFTLAAPPGYYKVVIAQNHPMPGRPDRSPPVVELYYEDPDKTPLDATVERNKTEFTFPLKRLERTLRKEGIGSERE